MGVEIPPKRAYLRGVDRRRQLLDAASRLFERGGFNAITMVALAGEAGVSRQLVYGHFADLTALYNAFFDDRVSSYADALEHLSAADTDSGVPIMALFDHLLTIPADTQRAVSLLVSGPEIPELEPVRDRLRSHVLERWTPRVVRKGIEVEAAGAFVWAVMAAILTLADLVRRKEISATAASSAIEALAGGLAATDAADARRAGRQAKGT